jgi:spore coat polysaccharide biosynthesis protein SpsF
MSSSRLPGKVLRSLLGKPMLQQQIERLRSAQKIEKLVVATSTDPSDDVLDQLCQQIGVPCARGSLNDVLDRFYQAALQYAPDHVVRLTGDCPLTDPALIDRIIAFHLDGNFDYSSNTLEPSFPDGLDAEIFCMSALERAWKEAKLPSEREHVTQHIVRHPESFRLGSYKESPSFSHLRWTVDDAQDFEMVTKIYEELYPQGCNFNTAAILGLIEKHPEFATCNLNNARNEGLKKSAREDELFLQKLGEANGTLQ